MEKATDILSADHRQVLNKLAKLEQIFTSPELDTRARYEIIDISQFFNHEVKLHFSMEEKILFPLMKEVPNAAAGPLKVMSLEHEEFYKLNEQLQDLAEKLSGGKDINDISNELREVGHSIIELLRNHIDKEDNVLFGMAENFLEEEALIDAAAKMRSAEESAETAGQTITLDLRPLPPVERHPLIFSTFDDVTVGKQIKIVNDHDPRPLHYQFEAERQGTYSWRTADEGPEKWVAYIKKIA